jgi:hypothetical protein
VELRAAVKRPLALLAAVLLLGAAPATAADQSMVLIVSVNSPVTHLDAIEVRKVFLGLSVMRNDLPLRALENRSDEKLHQAFLQNVVAMPESVYERRLLSIMLQQGGRRPQAFLTTPELLAAIAADPSAVSVAWASDVAQDRRIRVLRVLWRD